MCRSYSCRGYVIFFKKVFDLYFILPSTDFQHTFVYMYSMNFQRTSAQKILAKMMEYAIIILMVQDMNVFAMDLTEGRIVKSQFMKIMKVCQYSVYL